MEIRVLGPVEVVGRDGPVHLAGRQLRLLAALTVAAGRTSSTDSLIEAIWSGTVPDSAPKLVQVYVSQLRRSLGNGALIETRGSGYALADVSLVDAARFERLLAEGAAARRDGNPELALSSFNEYVTRLNWAVSTRRVKELLEEIV